MELLPGLEDQKMKKSGISVLLVLTMLLSLLSGCGSGSQDPNGALTQPGENSFSYQDPYGVYADDYDGLSQAIYSDHLGAFYELYEQAKSARSVSVRHALMAQAEAKLMEAAVMMPNYSGGGAYALTRVAPYTIPYALWGNDRYRYHNAVLTTELIAAEHIGEMRSQWARLKGSGTYEQWAKDYLTQKGYKLKDTYALLYSGDPETWDVLATSKSVDSRALINTYDGLYEYDCEGTVQPALATGYTVTENSDGTVSYTFTLRSDAVWVDSQGRQIAQVTADDFVAGLQHMMDAAGGMEYLTEGVILGADAYISGEITDFSEVGIKAPDAHTVVYTLSSPVPYFMTMLGYGVFAPLCRSYFLSKGGAFGTDYTDEVASKMSYGKTPNDIAYCGPYLISSYTPGNTVVFSSNPSYWNSDQINIKTITWRFSDGTDVLKGYNDTVSGTVDGANLNASATVQAKNDGMFERYAYVSSNDATTFFTFYNLNRVATANFNDPTAGVSTKTYEQLARSRAAMHNQNFRLALSCAVDRGAYNAQSVGEDLKNTSLRNTYTPGNFVFLTEEVTVPVGDVDKTYAAGTYYGQIMQDQIDADGYQIKVWDPAAENGIGSSDGFDGWYDPVYAQQLLNTAAAQLAAQGVEISSENPIYLDFPYYSSSETNTNMANAYKKSVERSLNGWVIVNLVDCGDIHGVNYAGYFISMGSEANYELYSYSGWSPDYGDPQTYLDTLLPDYAGYMTMMLGLF